MRKHVYDKDEALQAKYDGRAVAWAAVVYDPVSVVLGMFKRREDAVSRLAQFAAANGNTKGDALPVLRVDVQPFA